MARAYFSLSFAAAVLGAVLPAHAQGAVALVQTSQPVNHTTMLRATKTQAAPPLDASLSSPIWQQALKATSFENFFTREPAKYETVAYFLYDDKNLYVGVHAEQAGLRITATQNVDDAGVQSDDHVTFLVDTSGNGSRVYTFRTSPTGVHDEASTENARYAPAWSSVGRIMADGSYNVMMVIPLSDIRTQSLPVQRWKVNFVRFVAATNDEYTWAYEPSQTDPSDPSSWPTMAGVQLAAGKAARPQPHADVYTLARFASDDRFQSGQGAFVPMKTRALGVDVTYPITPTMSFVGTLNPDFSNVEQDQTTIAPQMFQRQYREYRPFFAQGANFINTLPNVSVNGIADTLFYTPGIGVFNRGLKVEGTAGQSSLGVLNVTGDGFNDTAFGYRHRNDAQTFTYAAQGVVANHTGVRDEAFGASINAGNTHSGEFTIAELKQENDSLSGSSSYLFASEGLQTAKYFAAVDYRDVAPNFDPIDGYTALDDVRGPRFITQYNGVGGRDGIVKSWNASVLADRFFDRAGQLREYDANFGLSAQLKNNLSLGFYAGPSGLRFDESVQGDVVPFSLRQLVAGYNDGTPTPVDASYAWGPFGGGYLQQMTISTAQKFGLYGLSAEYDGTVEHGSAMQPYATQWLRRVSITRSFGKNASLAIGVRTINGAGGFAFMPTGIDSTTNLAVSFHQRFANLDELYVDYGSPAIQNNTLHRLIVKYVFHAGGGTGT
jgi:hypothetical protein